MLILLILFLHYYEEEHVYQKQSYNSLTQFMKAKY